MPALNVSTPVFNIPCTLRSIHRAATAMAVAYTNQMRAITRMTGKESLRSTRRGRRLNREPNASLAPFSARSMASVWMSGMEGAWWTIVLRSVARVSVPSGRADASSFYLSGSSWFRG